PGPRASEGAGAAAGRPGQRTPGHFRRQGRSLALDDRFRDHAQKLRVRNDGPMPSEPPQAAIAARPLAVAQTWRREVRDTLFLTLPIAGGLLAEMGMGVIDYSMAGHLGPSALAAAGLGLQL